jgi:glucokinase
VVTDQAGGPALAGVDLGGTKIEAIVTDSRRAVLGQARCSTPNEGGPPAVVVAITEVVQGAAGAARVALGDLAGIGVGSPGIVDRAAGTVARAGNLPDWEAPFPLAAKLAEALGAPVHLGNDVAVAVDAEARLGAAKGVASFVALWWGTGIGGAFVADGKRWQGRGAAGEIGHTVVKMNGRRCTCGRRGCLEAYAGRAALETRARRLRKRGARTSLFEHAARHGGRLTSGVWEQALDTGDKLATKLIDQAIGAIGVGLASATNLLDVEAIIIGGGLGTRLGPTHLDQIKQGVRPHLFSPDHPPEIVITVLGDLGGAVGATFLVPVPAALPASVSDG